MIDRINPSRPNPGQGEKINWNFIFTLLCGASTGFVKASKGKEVWKQKFQLIFTLI